MVRASWAFAAPDGDVSYIGRSQEQSWTLAFTAAAARTAADFRDTTTTRARTEDALARRVLQRYRDRYAAGRSATRSRRRWPAASTGPSTRSTRTRPRCPTAAQPGGARVGAVARAARGHLGRSRLHRQQRRVRVLDALQLVRHRPPRAGLVRGAPGVTAAWRIRARRPLLARADGAEEARDKASGSHDVVPVRPRTQGHDDAVGPQLVAAGTRAAFQGRPWRRRVTAWSSFTAGTALRAAGGSAMRSTMRFTPTSCGVDVSFPTRPASAHVFTAYLRGHPAHPPGRSPTQRR